MDSENITKVELMRHGNVRIQEARKKTWRMGLCLRYGYTLVPFTEAKEGDLWGLVLWLQEMSLDLEVFMEATFIWRLQMPTDKCWARNQFGCYLGINHLHVIISSAAVNIPIHRFCLNILQNVVLFYASAKRVQFITSLLTLFNLHKLDFPRVRLL